MDEHMTVSQLIEKLQDKDPNALVIVGNTLRGEYKPTIGVSIKTVYVSMDGLEFTDRESKSDGKGAIPAIKIF